MTSIARFLALWACVAAAPFSAAQADQICSVTDEEYYVSRYVVCRDIIADGLWIEWLASRFDGSGRVIQMSEAEQFIAGLNELDGNAAEDISAVLSANVNLRSALRGLLVTEAFSEDHILDYCAYRFGPTADESRSLPHPNDPEFVRDIDYFFGCEE